ncbi:MAG: general secretion pathway protein GspC [Oleiphilaceae bacterium]|nr:general secretion pathway protein GspC [Oleiphilaceae bacterium]
MKTRSLDGVVRRVTQLSVVALTLYLAYLSSQLIWHVYAPEQAPMPKSFVSSAQSNLADSRIARRVDRYHLFGEANKEAAIQERPKDVPKTRLRLKLKGVFSGKDAADSGAIIEELSKPSEYYRLGDSLPGGVRLAEVHSDHVILDRNGTYEALYFDETSSSSSIAKVAPRRERSVEVNSPEDFISEATARLSENPERALASVGLGIADGGGYVFQGNNPMLAGMNLKKGDVIRSVNGHSLGNVQEDKNIMRQLYQQGSLEVEVVRDGASFFVNYPLR